MEAKTRKLNDAMELIGEKDRVIQILKDELAAHQLELVQKEEQLLKSIERQHVLESENKVLVDRWMSQKEKEANQMNEANAFVESALRTRESMATRVFSLFSNPTSKQSSPVAEKVILEPSILPCKLSKVFKKSHDDDINCLAISPDGSMLATGGNDKNVILHSIATGTPKASLPGSVMAIMSVAFSPTSEFIMASSNDNSIKIWDCVSRRLKHTLTGHLSKIFSAKYTDMNTVVSGSHDRTIKVWDLTKGICSKTIFTLSSCNDVSSLTSDGGLIVSGHLDNNVRIWDTKSGHMVREITGIHFGQVTCVQASPDYSMIMSVSRDNSIKLLDSRMYLPVFTCTSSSFRVPTNYTKACFSSDGTYVACGGLDGGIYIWQNGSLVSTLSKHTSTVSSVVWSSLGGPRMYSASDKDKELIEWGV